MGGALQALELPQKKDALRRPLSKPSSKPPMKPANWLAGAAVFG
jgi:hypothetical protein